jgi:phage-related minor tail protein
MDTVKSSMEDAFMSMVDGTKSAKDAFKDMAAMIIKELYRVLVVQQLVGGIASAFGGGGGSFFTAPSTGSFGLPFGGPMASGGPVDANKVYLVGEQGPELVIPRHSGTVVNAAQTAQAMGSGSGDITVQNNITVTGSDAAMVRTEIAKMIPQITNATKAAVIDAKQRGGQMAAAFR